MVSQTLNTPWQREVSARVVVIGGSSGGVVAVRHLLASVNVAVPVVVVIHVTSSDGSSDVMERGISGALDLPVHTAMDKMPLEAGHVYLCPADYHVLVERSNTLALSIEGKVNYCRPAIDVLFQSAADSFGSEVLGLLLTGSNCDGAYGSLRISARGGVVGVQDPAQSEAAEMPAAAIACVQPDMIGSLDDLRGMLASVRFPQ